MITQFRGPYWFLSNFYPCRVTMDRNGQSYTFPSSEHAYMSFKSDDPQWIATCADPNISAASIKQLSRSITLVPNWNTFKLTAMERALRAKFFQNQDLKDQLVATNGLMLVEGNHWGDFFWGVCNGRGENHLGKLLMLIRDEFTWE